MVRSVGATKRAPYAAAPRRRKTIAAARTCFFICIIPPEDIRRKAIVRSKRPRQKLPGSQRLSIPETATRPRALRLLGCWPPAPGSATGAIKAGAAGHACGPARKWRKARFRRWKLRSYPGKKPITVGRVRAGLARYTKRQRLEASALR